jgi:hypothetical protein
MSDRDPKKRESRKQQERPAVRPGEGTKREPDDHLGADETEVADVTPPARGPADPERQTEKEDEIDPTDDLTPG